MGYGIPDATKNTQQSRSDNFSTNVAELTDKDGNILEGHTFGGSMERSEEFYLGKNDTFENSAIDGQEGTELVTGVTRTGTAGEYEKVSVTTKIYPQDDKYKAVSVATTTTTTAA